jgi:cyclopropane-fatty-acyl-phospholipid synthase
VVGHWNVGGTHYQRTAEDWLSNMDVWRSEILDLFARTYGDENALKWLVYWRVFFMSCAEVWGHNQGRDWIVSHYLFDRR